MRYASRLSDTGQRSDSAHGADAPASDRHVTSLLSIGLFSISDAVDGDGVLGLVEEHAVIADAEAK